MPFRIHNADTLVENHKARREGDFMEPKALLTETEDAIGLESKKAEDPPIFLPKSQLHLVRKDDRLFLWVASWLYEKEDKVHDIATR